MKSFIRAITIIIVLTLIPMVSATAQITPPTVPAAPIAPIAPALRPSDVLMQLRTVLSAQTQQHGGGKVLVIPTSDITPQDMVTLMEDMTVMCRIFDKKLAQSNLVPGMPFIGRVTFPSLGDRSMGAMYVQGYGALFMTTVDFPLSPPPQTEEQEETEEEDADPVWEQMKQEMFSPEETAWRAPNRQEVKYDARKVKNLKSTLIKALVHTANIRGLKPDESVILTVTGSGISSNIDKIVMNRNNQLLLHTKDRNIVQILGSPSLSDLGISSPMVLTIRAKKSYIDALAQNKIDFDEFEEKIQLISYPCLGANLSRGSSPSFWPGATTGYKSYDESSLGSSSRRPGSRSSGVDVMTGESSGNRRTGRSIR
ncbi:MAG: hypothetical protein FVQ84_11785 [Planctomycetes bacterium]|nr:hypothetical protein [Planctomycetota bacterium]